MDRRSMRFNFTRDVVGELARDRPSDEALRFVDASGSTGSLTFDEIAQRAASVAAGLGSLGVEQGETVMTLIGARPEWVTTMLASWQLGAVVLPCSEQLRSADIRLRLEATRPRLIVTGERERSQLETALDGFGDPPACIDVDADGLPSADESVWADTAIDDPALVIFTSGTAGKPKGVVHTQGYLQGQRTQAEHWFGPRPRELAWCTAASGWSKSARNAFVAAWTQGAACMVHDGRFDPVERLDLITANAVNVLCQSPTEYRMIAKRASLDGFDAHCLRRLVSAGEPLNPEVMDVFREATGLDILDGYGQTETGQLTGMPADEEVRPGSMGKPLPGFGLDILDSNGNPTDDGELCVDPASVATFFHGYLGEPRWTRESTWRTGDHIRRDGDGYLWFEGRLDDVILSAGYRIGPFEVESALISHPAVAEAAAVSAPDAERGAVVRAVVVLRDGYRGDDRLARELQDHVKQATAPYKYPRIVEFADSLPKTASGKIKRAELRQPD